MDRKLISGLLGLAMVMLMYSGCASSTHLITDIPTVTEVTPHQGVDAYKRALRVLGAPFVWNTNGPDKFDCSGLIIWAYGPTMNSDLPFVIDGEAVSDATIYELYRYNSRSLTQEEVRVGDLVFITSVEGMVYHGGMVRSIGDGEVEFVNASTNMGRVIVDTWPLEGRKRDQWVVGFGRLQYRN